MQCPQWVKGNFFFIAQNLTENIDLANFSAAELSENTLSLNQEVECLFLINWYMTTI